MADKQNKEAGGKKPAETGTPPATDGNKKDAKPSKPANYDQFIIEKVFPSPESLLKTVYPPLNELLKDCLFVLDANTMLAPFLVGKDSLQDVAAVLKQLVEKDRLFLPEQAIREYARHRAAKIADAYGHIKQCLSEIPQKPKEIKIPMFENLAAYKSAVESSEKVVATIKEFKAQLHLLEQEVRNWNWNDPVSKLYGELFAPTHIISHGKNHEELSADLAHRVTHGIPPGFMDKSKDDGGIGDILIWHSILKLGKDRHQNVIFITNDGKADWMVKLGDEPLFPRFELVEEFHRETNQFFNILRFDRFLLNMGAGKATVAQITASIVSSAKDRQQAEESGRKVAESEAVTAIGQDIEKWVNRLRSLVPKDRIPVWESWYDESPEPQEPDEPPEPQEPDEPPEPQEPDEPPEPQEPDEPPEPQEPDEPPEPQEPDEPPL